MNVQSLYMERMGVEKGVYALCDWPDTTRAFFVPFTRVTTGSSM